VRRPAFATPGSLWRHRDFLLLWIGQSVSRFGDQFTGLAIPVIAASLFGTIFGSLIYNIN